jgi:septum site-determining protein MinC
MAQTTLKTQAFKLKGRLYTLTVFQLLDTSLEHIETQLAQVIDKAPKLFQFMPIVLDCTAISQQDFDLDTVYGKLKAHQLMPIAIHNASPMMIAKATVLGLAILNASSEHDRNLEIKESTRKNPLKKDYAPTKIISTPTRSGQQVFAKEADLIVTSSVSRGAELLSDGHIHVYGALRGRALAGMSGDKSARIFCHSLDAELISIAGFYRLSEQIPKLKSPCQIYLKDDAIQIEMI